MLIGMTVSSFADRKAGAILKLAKKFGVSFVEFNRSVWDDLPEVAAQIDGVASGYHLPLMSEDGFDFSCVDQAAQIDTTIDLLNKNYQRLNIRYCLSHPPEPEQSKESVQTSAEFLLENLSRIEAPILLENVEGWSERDFDKFYSMARTRLGNKLWGMCFDPAHAFLRADDLFLRFHEIANEVRCIHLSDCTDSHDAHLPFSSGGVLPIDRILKFVRAHHWRGIINLEIIPHSLAEIEPVIKSYLKVLRRFSKGKYFATLGRLAFGSKTIDQTGSNIVDVVSF